MNRRRWNKKIRTRAKATPIKTWGMPLKTNQKGKKRNRKRISSKKGSTTTRRRDKGIEKPYL